MIFLKKAELLAPAGNMEKFKMALHYGADAVFIKQCKNTRDSSTRRVLVMRHVLVGYELHENLVSIQGNLYVDTEQNRATKKLNCWELLKLV